jgi:3-oxoacyl-[acyl-carrier protein] reductase
MSYRKEDAKAREIKFEEINVGYETELKHTITQEDVNSFGELTGDYNPVHFDPEFASRTTIGRPVVHGMLTSSFISTMIGMLIPGSGALWLSQTLKFLNPAFIGDELTVLAKVKQKSPATRILTLEININNQHGTSLVNGESTVRVLDVQKKTEQREIILKANNIILVTGGSRGIGAASVKKLAEEGHQVVINYLQSEDAAKSLERDINNKGGQALAVRGDVSSTKDVDEMFSKIESTFGTVEAIVHCASPNPIPQTFENLDWEMQQNHFDIQLKGIFLCAKRALPKMTAAKSGAFVLLGSIFADGTPPVQQIAYSVAKSALAAFARSLAVEYGPKGIRINVVSPGMTQTEMIANIPEKTKMLAKMNTPLRRLADPKDVAEVVSFLLSPAACHVTGETIRVCGGIVMG